MTLAVETDVRRMAFETTKKSASNSEGLEEFWVPHSIDELARIQGVQPLSDPNVLGGGFPEDDDIDEFLDDIYRHR
jgi:hypothetical protein